MHNTVCMLPSSWRTERVRLRDVTPADSMRLLAIFNANAHIGVWDPTFRPVEMSEMAGVVADSLARRNARNHAFQMQAICAHGEDQPRDQIVGYYHMVFGAPQPDIIWVSLFVLDPAVQNQRYGSEVVAGLRGQWRALGTYRAAWAEVWLKNWPALRMWVKGGFDRILKFQGDPVLTPDGNASVVLEQSF